MKLNLHTLCSHKKLSCPPVKLNGLVIPQQDEAKYLGHMEETYNNQT